MFKKYKQLMQHNFSLGNALFGETMWPYIYYRTRFFFINSFVKIILHVTELYFIFIFFAPSLFHRLIIFRTISYILYGIWWGALEVLREYGRQMKRMRKVDELQLEVKYWLWLTLILLLLIDIAAILLFWPNWMSSKYSFSGAFHFYLIAILVQINLTMIVAVYHSGIYGLSRVYRPLFSLVGPGVLSFCIMVGGWFVIGIYALPLAFIIGSFLGVFLSLYYTLRMFTMLGIKTKAKTSWRSFKFFLRRVLSIELVLAGLSSMLLTASGPLIILLALFLRVQDWDYLTFLYLYLIIPILQLNVEWVFLFYFDLKRLSKKSFSLMLKRYHRYVFGFSIIISLFAWILSGLACLLYVGHWWIVVWVLLPWYLLRSFLAYLQINAFVRRLYIDIIVSGLFVVLSFFPFLDSNINILYSLLSLFIAFLVALIWLKKRRFSIVRRGIHVNEIHPYFLWLNAVRPWRKPILFYHIKLAANASYRQTLAIIKNINSLSKSPIWFTLKDEHTLLAYQSLSHRGNLKRETADDHILLGSAGLVENFNIQPMSGKTIKDNLVKEILTTQTKVTHDQIIDKFKHDFPNAKIFYLNNKKNHLSPDISPQVLSGLQAYVERPYWINKRGKFSVSALLEKGVATTLFIIDLKSEDINKVQAWLNGLFAENH
jgi:hypothetical protein